MEYVQGKSLPVDGTFSQIYRPSSDVRFWEIGEHFHLMSRLNEFLRSVLYIDQVPFELRDDAGRSYAVRTPVKVDGYRNLAYFLSQCHQWMDLCWDGYAYRADIQLFFDCFREHPFAGVRSGSSLISIEHWQARLFNEFVAYLRTQGTRRGVKKVLSDARGNMRLHEVLIGQYLAETLSVPRIVIPLRMDLQWGERALNADHTVPRHCWTQTNEGIWIQKPSDLKGGCDAPETRARIDTAAAMEARDRFFDNQRGADRLFFDRMIGHVCKLEQGERRRANHFHCVFLLDARGMQRTDVDVMKQIIFDRWRRVTSGHGFVYDSYKREDREELMAQGKWAIDPIDTTNAWAVNRFISYVSNYFAKDESLRIGMKPTPRARTLTMGMMNQIYD